MKSLSDKIIYAVQTNDLSYLYKVTGLKKQEINLPVNEEGDNLLIWAIKNMKWPLIENILKNNLLDVNAVNIHNETALHIMVNKIVSEDVAVEDKKKYGTLLKHFAGRRDVNVNIQNENGLTPWMLPFDKDANPNISEEEKQVIANMEKLFLARDDLNLNCQDKLGLSCLMLAGFRGQYDVIKNFLEKGADINLRDVEGNNILMQASNIGLDMLADVVVSREELDINATNKYKETALINALYKPFDEKKANIVKKILARKDVNVNICDQNGNVPLIMAYLNDDKDILSMILEKENVDVNIRDQNGNSLLVMAYQNNDKETFSTLMSREDIDLNVGGKDNKTLLMLAIERGDAKLVYTILGRPGIDINAFDDKNENVVMKAIKSLEKNGDVGYAILKVLLAHPDLDINAFAEDGKENALTTAISLKNDKVIDMILKRDDVDIDKPFNYSAIDTALSTKNLSLLYRLTDNKCFDAKDEDLNGTNAIGHILEKTVQLVNPDVFETISTDLLDACKKEEITQLMNHRNQFGDNALMTAIKAGAPDAMINIFLSDLVRHFGLVDIDFNAKNNDGETLDDLIAKQREIDRNSKTANIIKSYKAYCQQEGFQRTAEYANNDEVESDEQ